MKKPTTTIVSLALLTLGITSARAITFTDLDTWNTPLNGGHPTFTSSFNIAAGDRGAGDIFGYASSTHRIDSATVLFAFGNDNDPQNETVAITLGGISFAGQTQSSWAVTSPLGGGIANVSVFADLKADGVLDYTVTWSGNPLTFAWAKLTANATTVSPGAAPNSVPDGGTSCAMLGFALTGLGLLKRKVS
jgi:hypothetical protein